MLANSSYQNSAFRVSETAVVAANHDNFALITYQDIYFIKQLNVKSAAVHFKLDSNSILLHYQQQGTAEFGKNVLRAFYTKLLSPNVKLGIGGTIRFWNQREYQLKQQISPTVGLFYNLNSYNNLVISISNEQALHYNENGYLPNTFFCDWQRKVNSKLYLGIGLQQNISKPSMLSLNANWFIVDALGLNLALTNHEKPLAFGFIYTNKNIMLNIQTHFHEVLGLTNNVGILYKW